MYIRGFFLQDAAGDGTSGGGAGGAGGASGGAGAGSGAGTGDGAGGSGGAGSAAPWHGITDPDAAAYITNKGWQSTADVIKSYQGVEKFVGRDPSTLLVMPRLDDAEGVRGVLSKLGLPESPDKYEFDKPENLPIDQAYMDWARGAFHKIGLTASQVKELTKAHNEFIAQNVGQSAKDYELNVAADKQALQSEWRGGFDRMMQRAKGAAGALGFTAEVVDAIEGAIGYANTMKMFAEIGGKLGEDTFVSGDVKTPRFGEQLTPAEAKQQWSELQLDQQFKTALFDPSHPGHKAAKEKQTKLFGIMYPEG